VAENTTCNLCKNPATYANASDVGRFPSTVREFQHERFTVWRCRNCKSLHSKEDVELGPYYAAYPIHNQKLDYFSKRVNGNLIRVLRKHGVGGDTAVLDFGCGVGVVRQALL
jgi:predicted nucleic-acid-binding Zn-ribbon protein